MSLIFLNMEVRLEIFRACKINAAVKASVATVISWQSTQMPQKTGVLSLPIHLTQQIRRDPRWHSFIKTYLWSVVIKVLPKTTAVITSGYPMHVSVAVVSDWMWYRKPTKSHYCFVSVHVTWEWVIGFQMDRSVQECFVIDQACP